MKLNISSYLHVHLLRQFLLFADQFKFIEQFKFTE